MLRHNRISSINCNRHQSATSEEFSLGDASSPKVRIDDAVSPIRDESRKKYARDAQFSNFRKTMTFDTKYRRK